MILGEMRKKSGGLNFPKMSGVLMAFLGLCLLGNRAFSGEFPDQAIGFYSQGSLRHPTPLPDQGPGFLHLFLPRHRGYGSEGMIEILKKAALELALRFPRGERLQIADIAAPQGGEITMHASHQNGLDADLVYLRKNHHEQQPGEGEVLNEDFVLNGKLSPNFDTERNWEVLKLLVSSGRVNRFFMDPVLKITLCHYARQKGELASGEETLRRLQPYPGHANHFHMRLTCPAESPHCVGQKAMPEGSGCDSIRQSELDAVIDPEQASALED